MAGSFSNYLENLVLDNIFGGVATGLGATCYVGVGTATAGTDMDAGLTSEVSGNNYSRVAVTRNQTNFPASSGGAISNGTAITFPQASGSWGTVTQVAIFDAATTGNTLAWGDLTVAKAVGANDTLSFAIGDLDITLS